MRILQIVRPGTGGAARHVEILVRLLAARGHRIEVVASPLEDARYLDRLAAAGAARVYPVPIERSPGPADAAAFRSILRLVAAGPWDAVHCHTSKPGLLGRIAASLAGVRNVLYTAHGFYFNYPLDRARRTFYLAIERALAPLTTTLVCVSPQEGRQIESLRLAPRSKIVVLPNCVEEGPAPPEGPRDATVLWVGRLDSPKDPDTVLRALARVPGLAADFVGDGAMAPACRARAQALGLADRVRFLGHREDARERMLRARALVLSSAWEGLPYVLLEAAAAGCPVVATDLPGCRDACLPGENGYLFPPGDDAALADSLARLAADPALARRLGQTGRAWVLDRFGPAPWAEAMESLYATPPAVRRPRRSPRRTRPRPRGGASGS